MKILDLEQRTPEWFQARLGRLTGSRAKDMLATIKSRGEAAARRDLRVELVLERITGASQGSDYINAHMQRGIDLEPEALAMFDAVTGEFVKRTGFVVHEEHMAGCSLDGHLGDFDAIVEIKVPKPATHLEYLRAGDSPPSSVLPQLRHNLWITGAPVALFASYGPEFPEPLRLHVVEVSADDLDLPEYEERAMEFLAEVDAEVAEVMELAERAEAA